MYHQVWEQSCAQFVRKCTETQKCDGQMDGQTDMPIPVVPPNKSIAGE